MKFLSLSQGKVAIIDDADFENVGQFKWCAARTPSGNFYAQRTERIRGKQKTILLHCEILGVKGIDHIDGNGLDCRRENLRPATKQQNQKAFCRKISDCTSRYRGVYWYKERLKWMAKIQTNGDTFYLGLFDNEEAAARAYDKKAIELGFFKEALNFTQPA